MRKFLLTLGQFGAFSAFSWLAFYFAYVQLQDRYDTGRRRDAIYIWGDSQALRGVDLVKLSQETGRPVYSLAEHGAGVYDLSVFVERVPDNSTVIVALSPTVLARRVERDWNRSGLSFTSLWRLSQCGYRPEDLVRIVRHNVRPNRAARFKSELPLHPWAADAVASRPLSHYAEILQRISPSFAWKKNVYTSSLAKLREKHCRIILVDFPEVEAFIELFASTPYGPAMDDYATALRSDGFTIFTPTFDTDRNVFYDYTHLNKLGARELSRQLAPVISESAESDSTSSQDQ